MYVFNLRCQTSVRTSIQIFASLIVTFFADVPFSRISKASQRYPRISRNEAAETFRKTGLNMSFSFYQKSLTTSVTKMISPESGADYSVPA